MAIGFRDLISLVFGPRSGSPRAETKIRLQYAPTPDEAAGHLVHYRATDRRPHYRAYNHKPEWRVWQRNQPPRHRAED